MGADTIQGVNGPSARLAPNLSGVVLFAFGLFLSLSVRGLSLKPHGDFYGIWETGAALLDGDLPASFKRAPLYPLLVAAGGRLLEAVGSAEVPAQLAAQWVNALLLPVNAVLVYRLARQLCASRPGQPHLGAAGWAAWWFVLLPVGCYCTTNELVEPLLLTTVLLTLCFAEDYPRLAYVFAAAACMTRYDAIGLLPGLALADLSLGRTLRVVTARFLLAAAPLGLWLLLTAATWPQRGADHYINELLERPRFDPLSALAVAHRAVSPADAPRIPFLAADERLLVCFVLEVILAVLAIGGIATTIATRRAIAATALVFTAAYLLIHAIFPFTFDRFGYPLAPVYLAFAAAGASAACLPRSFRCAGRLGAVLVVSGAVLLLFALGSELDSWRGLSAGRFRWALPLPAAAVLAAALLWGLSGPVRTPARVILLLFAGVLALVQLRSAAAQLSGGAPMENLVVAARWVRDNLPPETRTLSAMPGLLRLYAGRRPADRFLGLEQIKADTWPQILDECRRRGIEFIIWYEGLFAEVGDYYVRRYRLDRFSALSQPDVLEGVAIERFWPGSPDTWLLRILP